MRRLFGLLGVILGISQLWAGPSIWRIAESGSVNEIQEYLDAGNPVDGVDDNGWTLLHHAAYGAQGKLIKYLLSKGADVNKKIAPNGFKHGPIVSDFAWEWRYFGMDSAGVTAYTPLHLALMNLRNAGSFDAVKALVEGGADITVPVQFNGYGPKKIIDSPMTVLEFVLTRFTYGMGGPDQVKAVKFLYAANSKLPKKKQMKPGKNMAIPEAYLINDVQFAVIMDDAKKVKTFITKKKVSPDMVKTAMIADSPAVLKVMIDKKLLDKSPKNGYDLLLASCKNNSVGTAKVLIENGVDPNWVPVITNSADPYNPKSKEIHLHKETPVLYYALFDSPDLKLAEYLLSKGAVPDADVFGKAVMEYRMEIINMLLAKGGKNCIRDDLLIDMITCRKEELVPIMELLLKNGANPNVISQNLNMNLLQIAESYQNEGMAEVLKKYGAK